MKVSGGKRTLAQKLGIQPDHQCFFIQLPEEYFTWIELDQHQFMDGEAANCQFAHLFLTTTNELEHWLQQLRYQIDPNGMIWVSWNKKSSRIPTELTEDTIRDTALALGLVDVKVCSINESWSALKLVIRKELR